MTTGSSHVMELLLGRFSKARMFFLFVEAILDILGRRFASEGEEFCVVEFLDLFLLENFTVLFVR